MPYAATQPLNTLTLYIANNTLAADSLTNSIFQALESVFPSAEINVNVPNDTITVVTPYKIYLSAVALGNYSLNDGDFYINTASNQVYQKQNGSWVAVGSPLNNIVYAPAVAYTYNPAQSTALYTTANAATLVVLRPANNQAATDSLMIPINASYLIEVRLVARDTTTAGKNYTAVWNTGHLINCAATAGTITLNGATATVAPDATKSQGTLTGLTATISVNTTTGALDVNFTPPTGNADMWHIAANCVAIPVQ